MRLTAGIVPQLLAAADGFSRWTIAAIQRLREGVVQGGSMPLRILREQVEHWLATSPSH